MTPDNVGHLHVPEFRLELWSLVGDDHVSLPPPYDYELIVSFLFHHPQVRSKWTYIREYQPAEAKPAPEFSFACEVLRDELRRVEYNIRDMNMTHADSGKWLKREEDREDSLKAAIAVLTARSSETTGGGNPNAANWRSK